MSYHSDCETWTVWSEAPEPLARSVSRAEAFELVKTTLREGVYAQCDEHKPSTSDERPQP